MASKTKILPFIESPIIFHSTSNFFLTEKSIRTRNEDLILSNIYTLLGFHQSAYEVFKSAADLTDRKQTSKLYVLEEKAKSHKNNFIIKDIRKLRGKNKNTKFLPNDFKIVEPEQNKFGIINKDIVLFNKVVKNENVEIYMCGNHKFEDYVEKIIDYIYWLNNCKNELIDFYNSEISEYTEETANDDWYDTLEIFSARIIVGQNGSLYAEISSGDDFSQDHILDIEMESEKITSMSYDG